MKDNLLIKLNESCNDLQSQIDELRKSKINNNGINGNNLTLNSEKSKIKIPKGSEINYFTFEKELIAAVWSLHKLESYLKG